MRIVFMGSAAIACPSVERMAATDWIELAGIVTQPDRPSGRALRVQACPVAERMRAAGLPLLAPVRVNAPDAVAAIAALRPELIVVIAYGQILGRELLDLPPRGCINLHASLLPRYRGAAPIQRAIINGERESGVTTMWMDAGMDTGDMIHRAATAIGADETAGELHDRLAVLGAETLMRTVTAVRDGTAPREPQPDDAATYAPKLSKAEGELDWRRPAGELVNQVRGMNPWPCAWCRLAGADGKPRLLRVLRAAVNAGAGEPGTVLQMCPDGPVIACGSDALALVSVQPEGRRVMSGQAFACGNAIQTGARLPCETADR